MKNINYYRPDLKQFFTESDKQAFFGPILNHHPSAAKINQYEL